MSAATASPLRAVLTAMRAGTGTVDGVARATGLSGQVVRAAMDQLVRLGRVEASPLTTGCPADGCGTCPSGVAAEDEAATAPGCGSGPRTRSGPVAIALRVRV